MEGDFVKGCLKDNPLERLNTFELLSHRFVENVTEFGKSSFSTINEVNTFILKSAL